MTGRRRDHDFRYAPVPTSAADDDGEGLDLVVATTVHVEPDLIACALEATCSVEAAETLLAHAPLFWTRVRLTRALTRCEVAQALGRARVGVRYVASMRRQSLVVPPPLDFEGVAPLRPDTWGVAPRRGTPVDPPSEGRWFLRDEPGGLAVDRRHCGTGWGTRLAVIDDDAADLERVDLDDTVLVGLTQASSASGHGALLIGWAVGARTHEGPRFFGVAPDASVRAYMIPRPGDDVLSLPLAIARAAIDGADVVMCATYVEGGTSPMLDDALELASRRGRKGRGCLVVLPAGREASSPRGSVHASLSLSLGDPASDPRVFCVAPGGRHGGWFLWREQHGRLRPFANRGPAVRWLAPGDDVTYPFFAKERLFHAESSGAAALAAGVLLLVVSNNPMLRAGEVFELLTRCAMPPEPLAPQVLEELADRADVLPLGRDRDGHDAKHGYGRMQATRACLAAADPIALELVFIGEDRAAQVWADERRGHGGAASAYSRRLARWAVRTLLASPTLEHRARVVLRHMRLLAADERRSDAHAPGVVARQIALLLRGAATERRPPRSLLQELRTLERASLEGAGAGGAWEGSLLDLAKVAFPLDESPARVAQTAEPIFSFSASRSVGRVQH